MPFPVVRQSLISATLSALRERIRSGVYGRHLLAERRLCADLGVSRPTLRAALKQLERDGVISVNGRMGRRILKTQSTRVVAPETGVVRMLQNNTPASFLNEHLQIQEYLLEHLHESSVKFHVETAPSCYGSKPEKALEVYIRSRPANLWILYLTTEPMQKWFMDRNLPCVLLGSRYEGISFSSVDEDYRATSRHAAGRFLARGHRSLALLASEINRPGDKASREGFESAIDGSRQDEITYYVGFHDDTTGRICKAIDWLLSRPKKPTAWYVHNPQTYFTVLSHLAQRGIRVGRDISIICRNSDPYFSCLVPTVAHYRRNMQRMRQTLLKVVQMRLRGEPDAKQQHRIVSQFCEGESLGTP